MLELGGMAAYVWEILTASGLSVDIQYIPFVCGALHDSSNTLKRVSETTDGLITEARQPFAITDKIKKDSNYWVALQNLATFIFQEAISNSNNSVNESTTTDSWVSQANVREAALVVANRTHQSNFLYIGVTGNSLSPGKATAINAASFVVDLTMSLAIGPIPVSDSHSVTPIFYGGGAL